MNKLKIAFDVDDTLIVPSVAAKGMNIPNYGTVAILKWFQKQGHEIIVWSGSGIDWATTWRDKLGIEAKVIRKGSEAVDLAFDDCDVELGKVNIKVKRINNNISREEWNKDKRECTCQYKEAVKVFGKGVKHNRNCKLNER